MIELLFAPLAILLAAAAVALPIVAMAVMWEIEDRADKRQNQKERIEALERSVLGRN